MTLKEAIQKASILRIDGHIVSVFTINKEGFFDAKLESGKHSWFMNEKGFRGAIFHWKGYWDTACGQIECFALRNICED